MLELSPDTEALARRLAEDSHRSVDVTIRDALETKLRSLGDEAARRFQNLPADIADRRVAALRRFADELSRLPERDTRSAKEIMDDLNPL